MGITLRRVKVNLLLQVNLIFMTAQFKWGRPLTRWISSIHCMMQQMSVLYINKLRIVHEVDFNSILNLMLGKILMSHSELYGLNSTVTNYMHTVKENQHMMY